MEYVKLLHILSGTVIAVTGLLQILLKKGGKLHRVIGQIYFWTWIVVVSTGATIGSILITFFGALGMYMAFTGYRFGVKKKVEATLIDKVIMVIALFIALGTLGWGITLLFGSNLTFGIIASVFGTIFLIAISMDVLDFVVGKKIRKLSGHKMQWFFEHYGRMFISYIAAMTAFSAIQGVFGVPLLNWLLPTVIGTAAIIFTGRHYRKKFKI